MNGKFDSISRLIKVSTRVSVLRVLRSLNFVKLVVCLAVCVVVLCGLGVCGGVISCGSRLNLVAFVAFVYFIVMTGVGYFVFGPSFDIPVFFLVDLFVKTVSYQLRCCREFRVWVFVTFCLVKSCVGSVSSSAVRRLGTVSSPTTGVCRRSLVGNFFGYKVRLVPCSFGIMSGGLCSRCDLFCGS